MKGFGAFLLAVALCRFFIFDGVDLGGLSAAAVDYVKAGFFGMLLWMIIGVYLVFPQPNSYAKSAAGLAVLIGVIESLMMGSCRLGWYWQGYQISDLERGAFLCNAVTGLPVREVVLTLYFCIFIYEICQCSKARST